MTVDSIITRMEAGEPLRWVHKSEDEYSDPNYRHYTLLPKGN